MIQLLLADFDLPWMLPNPCPALSSTTRVVILMERTIMGQTRLMKEMGPHIPLGLYIVPNPSIHLGTSRDAGSDRLVRL